MLTDEQIKALRDGCEGVTQGPWWWHPPTETDNDTCEIVCDIFGDEISIADYANAVNAAHLARCDPQTIRELCTRVLEAEAENKRLLERYDGHVRYGIDLARIIESLCAGDEIVEPKTTARHHYNIAVGAKAENETLRARVKVLEEALRPLIRARWGHDEDGWLLVKGVSHDELDRARKALEEGPKAPQ